MLQYRSFSTEMQASCKWLTQSQDPNESKNEVPNGLQGRTQDLLLRSVVLTACWSFLAAVSISCLGTRRTSVISSVWLRRSTDGLDAVDQMTEPKCPTSPPPQPPLCFDDFRRRSARASERVRSTKLYIRLNDRGARLRDRVLLPLKASLEMQTSRMIRCISTKSHQLYITHRIIWYRKAHSRNLAHILLLKHL